MTDKTDPYAAIGAKVVGGGTVRGSQFETGQRKADIELKQQILQNQQIQLQMQRQAEELARLRQTPPPQAPKPLAERESETRRINRAGIVGTEAGKAEFNLPNAEQNAMAARQKLRQLMGHSGFSAAVGAPNPFQGGLGFGTIPGTPARGFTTMLEQLKGGAFLQAIESLRGTGAISGPEGDKATSAIIRMSTATSEEDFRAAAADFDSTIEKGLAVARQKARMSGLPYSYEQLKAEQERRAARGK